MSARYETMLVEDGRVRLLDRHLDRLARSGAPEAAVTRAAELVASLCDSLDAPTIVRIDVAGGRVTATTRTPRPPTALALASVAGYDPADATREQKRADRRWAAAAERAAAERGADEPLLVSAAGLVGETSRGNVFAILADGGLATPPASGLLPGITRGFVLRQTDARERALTVDELLAARAAFVTTAGRGVVRVAVLDGVALGDDPRIATLAAAWRRA